MPIKTIKKFRVTFVSALLLVAVLILIWNSDSLDNKVKVAEGLNFENQSKIAMEKQLRQMLAGYPMEKMIPALTREDSRVAAFAVSIAKKESNWGKRVPVLNGEDCFNYWGYRGGGDRVSLGGYTCFSSPEEAVQIVSARISELVNEKGLNTPKKMIIWKCGSSCAGHSGAGVRKWISDVSLYFNKLIK